MSGFRNADALWAGAVGQAAQGWLRGPMEFSDAGGIPFFSIGNTNAAFRFGLSQGGNYEIATI